MASMSTMFPENPAKDGDEKNAENEEASDEKQAVPKSKNTSWASNWLRYGEELIFNMETRLIIGAGSFYRNKEKELFRKNS